MKFYSHNSCPRLVQCGIRKHHAWKKCTPVELRTVNLKEIYDTCQVEVTYRGFRADLMFTHSEYPGRPPTFLEIAVTHPCDQNKINSGIRIIESDAKSGLGIIHGITENTGDLVPQKSVCIRLRIFMRQAHLKRFVTKTDEKYALKKY